MLDPSKRDKPLNDSAFLSRLEFICRELNGPRRV